MSPWWKYPTKNFNSIRHTANTSLVSLHLQPHLLHLSNRASCTYRCALHLLNHPFSNFRLVSNTVLLNHFTLVLSNQRTLLQISYGFQETPQNGLLSWTFTFSILTEPQSLPCSYWDFSVHAWSNHWMNLLGPPPPRRLASVLNVFHFWKFVFTVE